MEAESDSDTSYVDVLVVDDDDAVRTSVADVVRSAGFTASEAEDGMAALAALESTSFGVVLLDMQMPRLSGLQFLAMHDGRPPVVVISAAHHDALSVPEGTDVFMFLRKPVPPDELLAVVALALTGPPA